MSKSFTEITAVDFDKFAKKYSMSHFQQTSKWGILKKTMGWKSHFVGIKEGDKIIAASLILEKPLPMGRSMFYAPRGPLMDYSDLKLVSFFFKHIKEYAKKHKAIFVKIDPAISYQERDINGDIIPNGKNNKKLVNHLKKIGFFHHGFQAEGNIATQYNFIININKRTPEEIFNSFSSNHKNLLRRNEKNCVEVRALKKDELDIYSDIMEHTAERRGFDNRPTSYYEKMWDTMGEDFVIYLAYVDLNKFTKNIIYEINSLKEKRKSLEEKLENSNHPEKIKSQLKNIKENLSGLNSRLKKSKEYKKSADRSGILNLGALMFLKSKHEIISLFGGAYGDYREFNAAYSLNWEMIKYAAENKFQKYNFYGIFEYKDKTSPFYGLYEFKRGFSGQIEEYIGEFDLVISRYWYNAYRLAYEVPKSIRRFKNHQKYKASKKAK